VLWIFGALMGPPEWRLAVPRNAVQEAPAAVPEFEVVAVCADKHSLLEAIQRDSPDAVLTDTRTIAGRSRKSTSPMDELSAREREVLAELATGKSNAAIASLLFLSKRGVEKHINAIFMKLNLRETRYTSRRVKAALMFLADQNSRTNPPGS
jgi:DNA-binding NarL/FixJ family response regulator